jgi:phosphosulfolactate phosphohydrolase-like enzyme
VIGLTLANITDYDTAVVDVYIIDENSTQAHYIRGLSISPNSTAKIITQGEKLILPETAGIRIVSDTEDSIDVVVSYVEIS